MQTLFQLQQLIQRIHKQAQVRARFESLAIRCASSVCVSTKKKGARVKEMPKGRNADNLLHFVTLFHLKVPFFPYRFTILSSNRKTSFCLILTF